MTLNLKGKVSHFGGPHDEGVAPDEGLAFIYDVDTAPHLFLSYQPQGTTGLARRLNPASLLYRDPVGLWRDAAAGFARGNGARHRAENRPLD